MHLSTSDWLVIGLFFIITLIIGLTVAKKSGKSSEEFFLGGRNLPWWLLGVSMVATTFSADTPNLVTDIVRKNGVAGNWVWWAFLLTGMLTVFVYAKLWRRSGVSTDLEFYELRYSGVEAKYLRLFRAIYLGVFFNVFIMATVLLAGIKIGGVLLGLNHTEVVIYVSIFTVLYSTIGGFRGVILTDFFQFVLSMIGMIWAAWYIVDLPEIGSISNLIQHENVRDKISFLPDFNDQSLFIKVLIIPIAIQWWSTWYPGAEPGGGGYVAQRMLSAKNEKDAIVSTLFFNVAHYALRPWPWIIIALASLIVFPDLASLENAYPNISSDLIKDDLAFSAMLSFLPSGLLGLVIAALIAALMSTISTHLNWGSSYMVNDVYRRFINPESKQSQLVGVGRLSTVVLMILSAALTYYLESAHQAFNLMLQIGAGTGLIFILRWFWWRINALSEITAMSVSFVVALFMEFYIKDSWGDEYKLLFSVGFTTLTWMAVSIWSKPTSMKTLLNFYELIKPFPRGWKPVMEYGEIDPNSNNESGNLPNAILMMFLGCVGVYTVLFGTGYLLYGQWLNAIVLGSIAIVCFIGMWRMKGKVV